MNTLAFNVNINEGQNLRFNTNAVSRPKRCLRKVESLGIIEYGGKSTWLLSGTTALTVLCELSKYLCHSLFRADG